MIARDSDVVCALSVQTPTSSLGAVGYREAAVPHGRGEAWTWVRRPNDSFQAFFITAANGNDPAPMRDRQRGSHPNKVWKYDLSSRHDHCRTAGGTRNLVVGARRLWLRRWERTIPSPWRTMIELVPTAYRARRTRVCPYRRCRVPVADPQTDCPEGTESPRACCPALSWPLPGTAASSDSSVLGADVAFCSFSMEPRTLCWLSSSDVVFSLPGYNELHDSSRSFPCHHVRY